MQCSVFNLPFQIAIYTQVITATVLFLQFNFVVILRWYFKKRHPSSCPGTIAVKDWAILTRYPQIWHKARSQSFDFKVLKFPTLFIVIFYTGLRGLGSNIFRTQVIKKIRLVWLVFPDYPSVSYDYGLCYLVSYNFSYTEASILQLWFLIYVNIFL